ncbi:MAG: hypothetical protein ACOC9W_01820 [Persicimonas sp.]
MLAKGIQLTLMVGPKVAVPAPMVLTEALETVEVSLSAMSPSGFQLVFNLTQRPSAEGVAQKVVAKRLLAAFNRLILMVTLGGKPRVLVDGIITNRQVKPGEQPGQARLTITGEDLSFVMDRTEEPRTHPGQEATTIVTNLIGKYAQYGLSPKVIPPPYIDPPNPVERTPSQQATDLAFIEHLAEQAGYVFYISPGSTPGTNTAYWGPPKLSEPPQPALSVNMGAHTNVEGLDFESDSTQPVKVLGEIIDSRTNTAVPVPILTSLRQPLSATPPWEGGADQMATRSLNLSGASLIEALAEAQGIVDRSMEGVVKARGSLDALRYGGVLQPNGLVGVRGAGHGYDGMYYVKSVTHKIQRGEYKQDFELTREGLGTNVERLPV